MSATPATRTPLESAYPEDEIITFAELARRLGVRRSYVTALKHDGRLVLSADGRRVLYHASLARIQATRDPSKITPKPAKGTKAPEVAAMQAGWSNLHPIQGSRRDYQAAKAHREHYRAELARLEYEAQEERLIDASLVSQVIDEAVTRIHTRLIAMADTIAARTAGEPDVCQVKNTITSEVEAALTDLYETFRRTHAENL